MKCRYACPNYAGTQNVFLGGKYECEVIPLHSTQSQIACTFSPGLRVARLTASVSARAPRCARLDRRGSLVDTSLPWTRRRPPVRRPAARPKGQDRAPEDGGM